MNLSIQKGLSFGLVSGIITTLGLIVGLDSGTHDKAIIISGIFIIAVADAMSDAFGVHVSEESEKSNSQKHIWTATLSTFASKFVFSLSFVLPIIFLPLTGAIIVSIIWGLLLIAIFSYYLSVIQNKKPTHMIFEHIFMAILVIILTYLVGGWISNLT